MEEAFSQGKNLNKEQEEVLRSKPGVVTLIDELEKLRQPLASAVSEEITLALQQHADSSNNSVNQDLEKAVEEKEKEKEKENEPDRAVDDILPLLYFGSLFDVKKQNDFTSMMLTRTIERGSCLTYDYVTDEDTEYLGERDLDLISTLGGLLISRPVDSSLSHKNALQRCIEHAKLWMANSEQPIEENASITYAGLRERLNKIMASDYFTTIPEIKAPVEVAAAAGDYVAFQLPIGAVPITVPVQVEDSAEQYFQKNEETTSYHEPEIAGDQSGPAEDVQKDEKEPEHHADTIPSQQERDKPYTETEYSQNDVDQMEQQYAPRRGQRGRGGGGRRGNPNTRGGRGRGGGAYQNGRGQYYDQPGNYYPRNYNNNNRGRGSRGGGHGYNHHGSASQGSHATADVGVAS